MGSGSDQRLADRGGRLGALDLAGCHAGRQYYLPGAALALILHFEIAALEVISFCSPRHYRTYTRGIWLQVDVLEILSAAKNIFEFCM